MTTDTTVRTIGDPDTDNKEYIYEFQDHDELEKAAAWFENEAKKYNCGVIATRVIDGDLIGITVASHVRDNLVRFITDHYTRGGSTPEEIASYIAQIRET